MYINLYSLYFKQLTHETEIRYCFISHEHQRQFYFTCATQRWSARHRTDEHERDEDRSFSVHGSPAWNSWPAVCRCVSLDTFRNRLRHCFDIFSVWNFFCTVKENFQRNISMEKLHHYSITLRKHLWYSSAMGETARRRNKVTIAFVSYPLGDFMGNVSALLLDIWKLLLAIIEL